MRYKPIVRYLIGSLCVVLVSGCATVRTLTDYQPGDPVFMSGTRLDVAAIADNRLGLKQFHSKPPDWPWLDLPFSFVADLFFWMLPRTAGPPSGTSDSVF